MQEISEMFDNINVPFRFFKKDYNNDTTCGVQLIKDSILLFLKNVGSYKNDNVNSEDMVCMNEYIDYNEIPSSFTLSCIEMIMFIEMFYSYSNDCQSLKIIMDNMNENIKFHVIYSEHYIQSYNMDTCEDYCIYIFPKVLLSTDENYIVYNLVKRDCSLKIIDLKNKVRENILLSRMFIDWKKMDTELTNKIGQNNNVYITQKDHSYEADELDLSDAYSCSDVQYTDFLNNNHEYEKYGGNSTIPFELYHTSKLQHTNHGSHCELHKGTKKRKHEIYPSQQEPMIPMTPTIPMTLADELALRDERHRDVYNKIHENMHRHSSSPFQTKNKQIVDIDQTMNEPEYAFHVTKKQKHSHHNYSNHEMQLDTKYRSELLFTLQKIQHGMARSIDTDFIDNDDLYKKKIINDITNDIVEEAVLFF